MDLASYLFIKCNVSCPPVRSYMKLPSIEGPFKLSSLISLTVFLRYTFRRDFPLCMLFICNANVFFSSFTFPTYVLSSLRRKDSVPLQAVKSFFDTFCVTGNHINMSLRQEVGLQVAVLFHTEAFHLLHTGFTGTVK